jgi:hypothetical protein
VVGLVDLDPAPVAWTAAAEMLPVARVPKEDADRSAAGRAVRLRPADRQPEDRGPVPGQERQRHRHLLNVEQPQPPASRTVGLQQEIING